VTFEDVLPLLRGGIPFRRHAWLPGVAIRLGPENRVRVGARLVTSGPLVLIWKPGLLFGSPWHPSSPDLLSDDWTELMP
jgi:hypothetical protein